MPLRLVARKENVEADRGRHRGGARPRAAAGASRSRKRGRRCSATPRAEQLLRDYTRPILRAAGLEKQNIQIVIINDSTFNAFVADGRRIFVNYGAIMQSETPNQMIGVLAHETGHLAGGHLAKMREQLAQAQTQMIIAMLLGAGAMVAGARSGNSNNGLANAGAAAIAAPQEMIRRIPALLSAPAGGKRRPRRGQVLTATGQSAKGMYETFKRFTNDSLFAAHGADPYLQSHPMPAERVAALEELARSSPYWDKKDDPALQLRHDMMRAKISAFMERQDTVYRRYPLSNDSLPARYAHAITTYLHGDLRTALAQIDGLIQLQPNNPYFYELRGQALLEGGKPAEAIAPLRKAVQLSNNAPLIEMLLGQALVATDNKAYTEEAITILRAAVARETEAPLGYTQLAMAYGRKGDYAEADLASAQAAYPSRRQQDRARSRLARQNPFRDRHARMGQGRRHRHRKAAARPKEQLDINRAELQSQRRTTLVFENRLSPRGFANAFVPPARSRPARARPLRRAAGRIGAEFLRHPARRYRDHRQELPDRASRSAGRGDGRTEQAPGRRRRPRSTRPASPRTLETIFNSPRGVMLGNKDGDVTFVEFFDYNCGYCKRAMADMLDLMKTDPKLKVVLKEFPVLSQGSVEAAQVAVAVRMQDPSGKKYLDFHQKLLGGRGPADKARALAAAKDAGLDMARIEKDMASPEVHATIEENFKLAEAMGMNGTPSYVIGKQVVVGAVGLDGLKEKIGIARCGKATC